jgi:hypothetical protein
VKAKAIIDDLLLGVYQIHKWYIKRSWQARCLSTSNIVVPGFYVWPGEPNIRETDMKRNSLLSSPPCYGYYFTGRCDENASGV